jgi:hypothetical protein
LEDEKIQEIKHNIKEEKSPIFSEDEEGVLWYKGKICVPNVKELKDKILHEAHESAYSIHLGRNKMYHDLKATYWWYGIKRDVALCNTCQRVETEHQRPTRKIVTFASTRLKVGRDCYRFRRGIVYDSDWI